MIYSALLAMTLFAAQSQDTLVAPRITPWDVRIVGDTVWWVGEPTNRTGPLAVIGFSRTSGRFFAGRRSRSAVRQLRDTPTLAASLDGRNVVGPMPVAYGFQLSDTTPQRDPRNLRSGDGEFVSTPKAVLQYRGRTLGELRIRVSGAERRRLYLASGEKLKTKETPPPFTTTISSWAAGDGFVAFSFDAPSPPEPEEGSSDAADPTPDAGPQYLGGLLVVDTNTLRIRQALHPRLITKQFVGMEIAAGAVWANISPWLPTEPALDDSIVVARYDLATGRWRFYKNADVPIESPSLRRSDGDYLYFIGNGGIAVLNARTSEWSARYLRDSSYVLPTGLDTTVTIITAVRPSRAQYASDESVEETAQSDTERAIERVLDELHMQAHRTAFKTALRGRLPVQEINEAVSWSRARDYCDNDCPFIGWQEEIDMKAVLGQPDFAPFLYELLERYGTYEYGYDVLEQMGPAFLRNGLKHALSYGEIRTATEAAEALEKLGDSTGRQWLRQRLDDPEWFAFDPNEVFANYNDTPVQLAITLLAQMGDTAFLPRALSLIRDSVAARPRLGYGSQMLSALAAHRDQAVRARVAEYFERSPKMWPVLMFLVPDSQSVQPWIRGPLARVSLRLIRSPRAFEDSIATSWPASQQSYVASRAFLLQHAIDRLVIIRVAEAVPAFIETFDLDPEQAYMKHSGLIVLTGNDTAPQPPSNIPPFDRMAAVKLYWQTWWKDHGSGFKPVDAATGRAALERWAKRN